MVVNFVNLTPHPIRLRVAAEDTAAHPRDDDIVIPPRYKRGADGEVLRDEKGRPVADPARVAVTPGRQVGEVNGVPIYSAPTFGEVEGLPEPQEGTIYIVSSVVASRLTSRDDVVVPGTGPKDGTVRDEQNRVFAVTRLVKAC